MNAEAKRESYVGQAWLVITLAALYGGALAGVETTLAPRIAQNKKNETYDVIPDLVLPGADKARTVEMLVEPRSGRKTLVYQAMAADGTHQGWVIPAGGQGFNDRIELLVGLDPELSTITGLYVLDQKETPGLGDYISDESFQSRFRDKPTDKPLVVVKSEPQADNEIRAISGATISSESVSAIVNSAIAELKEPILEQARTGGGTAAPAPAAPADNRQNTQP
jgi:electron transport complex protein RnfG